MLLIFVFTNWLQVFSYLPIVMWLKCTSFWFVWAWLHQTVLPFLMVCHLVLIYTYVWAPTKTAWELVWAVSCHIPFIIGHSSHLIKSSGFISCIFMCPIREFLVSKVSPHSQHLYSFSPWTSAMCLFLSPMESSILSHTLHMYSLLFLFLIPIVSTLNLPFFNFILTSISTTSPLSSNLCFSPPVHPPFYPLGHSSLSPSLLPLPCSS